MQGLKELRKKKGITQIEAALFCGVSLQAWFLWEKGVAHPTEENQAKIRDLENLPDKK